MKNHKTLFVGLSVAAVCLAGPLTRSYAQDDVEFSRKGVELAKNKKYGEAAEEFSKAIKANPKAPRHYSNRGKAYRAAGKLNEAVADFTKLIELCLLYTSPSPRDRTRSRMPSSA